MNNFRKPVIMAKGERSERTDSSGSSKNRSFNVISHNDFNKLVLPWTI